MTFPNRISSTEYGTYDVHAAKALFAGKDECRCKVCKRVAIALDQGRYVDAKAYRQSEHE